MVGGEQDLVRDKNKIRDKKMYREAYNPRKIKMQIQLDQGISERKKIRN